MALHGCRKPDAINRRKKLEMCVLENYVREQIIKTHSVYIKYCGDIYIYIRPVINYTIQSI